MIIYEGITPTWIVKKYFNLQSISISLTVMGIIIEFAYNADIGFVLITVGALLFGVHEKIQRHRRK